MRINIKKIGNGILPEYKTIGSAGADCYARLEKEVIIKAGKNATIPLGFAVEIPDGYEMQIRGRSGLASKSEIEGFTGTIDSDYRGEVNAIIFNHSDKEFHVKNGDRIAQAIIAPIIKAEWYAVDNLSETQRGKNGFGSTGIEDTKRFYEPFKTVDEVEIYLGRNVYINGETAVLESVSQQKDSKLGLTMLWLQFRQDGNLRKMSAVTAFMQVKIEGHNFGRLIKEEL